MCWYDLGNEMAWGFRHTGERRYPSPPAPGCRLAPAWRIKRRTMWCRWAV